MQSLTNMHPLLRLAQARTSSRAHAHSLPLSAQATLSFPRASSSLPAPHLSPSSAHTFPSLSPL
eukprot:6193089-Pleurochrysis_carterae.AAC.1